MDIQDEIIKTIELLIGKSVENRFNLDVASVVTSIDGNKAKVIVDGNEYWIKNTLELSVGDGVWLHIPNSRTNITQMFMVAKR